MTTDYFANKREQMNRSYLEQKKLMLSRASRDYEPENRHAKIDTVKHVGASFSFGKEKRMPDPKIVCKGVYTPHYESLEPHVRGVSMRPPSCLPKAKPKALAPVDRDYNADYRLVKPRTQVATMRSRPTRQPVTVPRQVDVSYDPVYTQVQPRVTHTTDIKRQSGRDRAVLPTSAHVSSYSPEKPFPRRSVSAWSSISNPRSEDVSNLSRELDFLIQHTEQSWKHVDDTLSQFADTVPNL